MHRAHYARKPRGGPPDLAEAFEVRYSLCCGRDGCRHRVLPPSVLFWGRRVYWAPVVLVVSALRQGRNPHITLERLKGLCNLWRSTVKRWQRYFIELFPRTECWRRLSGRLMPPVDERRLPGALLSRFDNGCAVTALAQCLQALAMGP